MVLDELAPSAMDLKWIWKLAKIYLGSCQIVAHGIFFFSSTLWTTHDSRPKMMADWMIETTTNNQVHFELGMYILRGLGVTAA
jgi:hypothetical protein